MTRTTVHPPTPAINQHHTISAAAVAGLVGTLLALTLSSASAMPGRGEPPAAPAVPSHSHYVSHGCFITPHTTNEAVLQELPVCYTYVP